MDFDSVANILDKLGALGAFAVASVILANWYLKSQADLVDAWKMQLSSYKEEVLLCKKEHGECRQQCAKLRFELDSVRNRINNWEATRGPEN